MLFKIIRTYALQVSDQDDLFQEICFQLYRSIPSFKGRSAVSTWIYRISLNTAIKWSTKEKKHQKGRQNIDHSPALQEINYEQSDDRIQWLYDQIHQFNDIDKSLTLLLLEGYSYKSIAEMTGISETNIGVKIHRIKKQLVKTSKEYDYGT